MDEISIKVKDRHGNWHDLIAPTDMNFNLMEVCKAHGLDIKATCGGMALCSTCHVYILSDHELPETSEDEEDIMDHAFFVEDNSRLACQIYITENLHNLELELAPESE